MKTKYFKVTLIKYYALDYYDKNNEKRDMSVINGWPAKVVQQDWFENINQSHATRDSYGIRNATKIEKIELVDKIEDDNELKIKPEEMGI